MPRAALALDAPRQPAVGRLRRVCAAAWRGPAGGGGASELQTARQRQQWKQCLLLLVQPPACLLGWLLLCSPAWLLGPGSPLEPPVRLPHLWRPRLLPLIAWPLGRGSPLEPPVRQLCWLSPPQLLDLWLLLLLLSPAWQLGMLWPPVLPARLLGLLQLQLAPLLELWWPLRVRRLGWLLQLEAPGWLLPH